MDVDKMKAQEIAIELLKKIDKTGQLRSLEGVKACALIVCEELSKRLPNINDTPPDSRKEEEMYMQFWFNKVPSEIRKIKN